MEQPIDLNEARDAFVTAVSRHDRNAPPVPRDVAETLAKSICKTSNICTNANIQNCKGLIIAHVTASSGRLAALKDYMITLAKAFCPREADLRIDTTKPGDENEGLGKIVNGKVQQPPLPAFKRLHLLYLLHDVMIHMHSHAEPSRSRPTISSALEQLRPLALRLAQLAVCGGAAESSKTVDDALAILAIWRARLLFTTAQCDDLRQTVDEAAHLEWNELLEALEEEEAKSKGKGTIEEGFDWTLPDRHSNVENPNAQWHELPAANGIYMKRTRGFPLRAVAFPDGGYEIDGAGREADYHLREEVSALYQGMVRCYEKLTDPEDVQDIDAMGNVIWKDADRPTRNYWGWSLEGMDRRKELARKFAQDASGYDDLPAVRLAGVNSAVERAKALAAERSGALDRQNDFDSGRGGGWDYGRGGFRGGNRVGFRGGHRGDFRGGRGRGRW